MNRADGEAARGLLLPQVSPQGSRGFVRIILRAINIRAMVTRYRLTIKVKALFPLFPIEIARCRDRATFRCEKNPARRCDQSKDQETSVSRLMKRRKIRSSSSRGIPRLNFASFGCAHDSILSRSVSVKRARNWHRGLDKQPSGRTRDCPAW